MRETILSNCERNFILKAASELKRLDGRKLDGFRNVKILFGNEWGLCYVSLGESKVLTQVTCEIQEPKAVRPNEGLIFINVELSSMAAPHFEGGRSSDLSVHLNRVLEKCIKDSRAVDLESLCIIAEEKVWVLKVDVNILNHDGSLVDCASISALAALAHFKRPDVTMDGQEIKVHQPSERDPIPITLHHYPICVSFALLNNSENIFADPTAIEEKVSDASLTFGINAYREICCLHLGGSSLTKPKIILSCSIKAANRAKEVVEMLKQAINKDLEIRQEQGTVGFVEGFQWNKKTGLSKERLQIQLSQYTDSVQTSILQTDTFEDINNHKNFEVTNLGNNCAELNLIKSNIGNNKSNEKNIVIIDETVEPLQKIHKKDNCIQLEDMEETYGEGGTSKWKVDLSICNVPSESDSCSEQDEICEIEVEPKQVPNIELNSDSEEEEVVILNEIDISSSQNKSVKKSVVKYPESNAKIKEVPKISTPNYSTIKKSKKNRKRKKKINTN